MTGYLQRDHRAPGKVCLGLGSSAVVPSKGSLSLNVNHPSPVRREGRVRSVGVGGVGVNSLPRRLRGPTDGPDSSWKAHYRCECVWLPAARSPSHCHQNSCGLLTSHVAALARSAPPFPPLCLPLIRSRNALARVFKPLPLAPLVRLTLRRIVEVVSPGNV